MRGLIDQSGAAHRLLLLDVPGQEGALLDSLGDQLRTLAAVIILSGAVGTLFGGGFADRLGRIPSLAITYFGLGVMIAALCVPAGVLAQDAEDDLLAPYLAGRRREAQEGEAVVARAHDARQGDQRGTQGEQQKQHGLRQLSW